MERKTRISRCVVFEHDSVFGFYNDVEEAEKDVLLRGNLNDLYLFYDFTNGFVLTEGKKELAAKTGKYEK